MGEREQEREQEQGLERGMEQQQEQQQGEGALSTADKLALLIKSVPSLHEAVLFLQPIPLRVVLGLARAAGLRTATLEADLRVLGIATRQG